MADKKIFIDDSPKNPDLKMSPFDHTYTTNITGRFGKVNVAMLKYYPAKSKVDIKPYFAFDMMPLVFPIQTNVRCHIKFYAVPLRILWKDFEDFASQIGTDGLPTNGGSHQFVVPYIKRTTGWNDVGTLAEQIGCCNQRLVAIPMRKPITTNIVKGLKVTDYSFPILDTGSFQSSTALTPYVVMSPSNTYVIKPHDIDRFNDVLFTFNYVDNDYAQIPASVRAGFDLHVGFFRDKQGVNYFHDYVSGEYTGYTLQSSISLTFSNSVDAFNNSTVPTYIVSNGTAVNIDGHNLYEHVVYVRVPNDDFLKYLELVATRSLPYSLILEFSSLFRNVLFPSTYYTPNEILLSLNLPVYKDVTSTQGGFELSTQEEQMTLISRLGFVRDVVLSAETVGSDIITRYDSVDGADPKQPICALPFRAVEFIHNYFFRNPRIAPFYKDGIPSYNKFLTNVESGADSTTPVDTWNALYETDYFTSCVKEPQFGNAPLVGVTVNDTSDTGILHFDDGQGNDYNVTVDIGEDGNVLPLSVYKDTADRPNIHRLQELIQFGISINDLRNVSTFQRMLERMQRTGYRYANVIYEFFGTNPPIGDHYPRYLGGISRNMSVDKITNVAQSEGNVLGEFAGDGKFRYPTGGDAERISTFITEPSYIVAIQYFTVTPTYSQYMPKHLFYKDPLDFYLNPEFAFMGPQPVYKKELAGNQLDDSQLDDVFGYNRPYAELFSNVDEVHGLYKTSMSNFLLQRFFGQAPELNESFIEINSDDLTNIFSVVENTDKLFGQVMFKIHAELPAPRSYMPRSI